MTILSAAPPKSRGKALATPEHVFLAAPLRRAHNCIVSDERTDERFLSPTLVRGAGGGGVPLPSGPPLPPTKAKLPAKRRRRRKGAPKPSGGQVGREPKLNDARIAAIAATLAEGRCTFETACQLNGVSVTAASYWLAMARAIIERVPGKAKDEVSGEEPEAESPWPRLPAPLLVRFLRAITHARAAGEAAQTKRIQEQGDGGQVIEERIEETFNETTRVRRIVTVKRYTAPDWRARFALVERLDKLPARAAPPPTGARPAEGQGGQEMSFLEIVRQAYALAHKTAPDPRALPPATIEGKARPLEPRDARSKQGPVSAGDA